MNIASTCKIKVLIVDDSALIRALLQEILESDPRMQIVAAARDAYEARELIKQHNPDVITLDIEMPKMNGITFLKNIMRLRPMPVVMISTLTQQGAPATLEALELGAVDFVPKPKSDGSGGLEAYRATIIDKVAGAATARVRALDDTNPRPGRNEGVKRHDALVKGKVLRAGFICAVGASTGGTEALKEVITALPANAPPLLIAQHIPAAFSASYAKRVDGAAVVKVFEAQDGQKIEPGCVYIAPGDSHLTLALLGGGYVCKLNQGELVNRHRPSVEVLFDSVLAVAGNKCMGVLLTGMGADGSEALLRMRQAGRLTIAQDEQTSVVWGMPGMAVKLGGAEQILPLDKVAKSILGAAFR